MAGPAEAVHPQHCISWIEVRVSTEARSVASRVGDTASESAARGCYTFSSTEEALVDPRRQPVILAGRFFEPGTVQDAQVAASVVDQPGPLEDTGRDGDGRTPHPEHR